MLATERSFSQFRCSVSIFALLILIQTRENTKQTDILIGRYSAHLWQTHWIIYPSNLIEKTVRTKRNARSWPVLLFVRQARAVDVEIKLILCQIGRFETLNSIFSYDFHFKKPIHSLNPFPLKRSKRKYSKKKPG